MANKDKISFLTKHQMRVLYYKCRGLTYEIIADKLERSVKTVQDHMTKIYSVLEIKQPGKSKYEMDSELKNEICPIIREMFGTYEEIEYWAPKFKGTLQEEKENPAEKRNEPLQEDPQPPYTPPPSLEKILNRTENQSTLPEIIEPPPPGIRRINWWLIIGGSIIGLLVIIFLINNPSVFKIFSEPTNTPTQLILTLTAPPPSPTEVPTGTQPFTITPTVTNAPTQTVTPTASPNPTATPIVIVTKISDIDEMVLITIPEGEFLMGSDPIRDLDASPDEMPQYTVFLDTYWIDQTEVTNEQYRKCVASGSCTKPGHFGSRKHPRYYDNPQFANYPVIFVSWDQAAVYCEWAGRRLPTEAEWEKAARGPEGLIYPWGNEFDGTLVNYCDTNCPDPWREDDYDDGYGDTSPVGNYPEGASIFSVLDMAGNVQEWVADGFEPYPDPPEYQTNPFVPADGRQHIIRGGSWGDTRLNVRLAVRSYKNMPHSMDFTGFRCALNP